MAFDWKKTVASVAPGLANILGGPLAGMATSAICSAFGLSDGTPEVELASAIAKMTPEQALQLKQNEAKLAIDLKQLDIDIYKIDAEDRISARDREKAVGSKMVNLLAVMIMVAFIGMVGFVVYKGLPVDSAGNPIDAALIGTLVGYLSAKAEQVVSYFFGSSQGSQRKTEHLAERFDRAK